MRRLTSAATTVAHGWLSAFVAAYLLSAVSVAGQGVLAAAEPVVVEAGPHDRVWEYATQEPDESGAVQEVVHRYTEVATGLNFFDPNSGPNGAWLESKEEFQLVEGAAVARQGQHQLLLLANIAEEGAVDALTSDDRRFVSNPRYLSFYDVAAQKNVLLAEVKDSIGQLVAPNVVLYDDCWDSIPGAIRVTYAKWGWEVDVLLYAALGDPKDYGLNPESTLVEIYTEFHAAPEPLKIVREVASGLPDTTLNFGNFQIDRGKAFALLEGGLAEQIGVAKTWAKIGPRQWLVESVPFLEMKPLLDTLPRQEAKAKPRVEGREARDEGSAGAAALVARHERAKVFRGRNELVASLTRAPKQTPPAKPKGEIQLAAAARREVEARPAVVIDYVTLNSSQSGYTLAADKTFFVNGLVVLSGTTTLEGTVVKFSGSGSRSLQVTGTLKCLTTPWRPAIFSAKDDDSVGEVISGSTGSPTNYYGAPALELRVANQPLHDVRFAYADTGVFYYDFTAGNNNVLSHAQFVRCNIAVRAHGYGGTVQYFKVRNALMDQCRPPSTATTTRASPST